MVAAFLLQPFTVASNKTQYVIFFLRNASFDFRG